ncbi:piggyBac transposable element-derived protein 4-like [Uloborus diversus]|uniref:piggyBac transposable element-derived protein 4-like n=1 Tax=Uloborus diversus TaxID=327109 RepID=UPI0024095866|nr:piggyBac transposable element-derived protein 4-like [Uloborus diversus]
MSSDSELKDLIESSEEEYSSSESESEDDSLDCVRNWCKLDSTSAPMSSPQFQFTGNPGIKHVVGDLEDPLEYLNLFFDRDIVSFIVSETNEYAADFFENSELTPGSRALSWQYTNEDEMKKFISLLLLQRVVQKPVEKWFWSKRPSIYTPFFGKIMTEKRYGLIMKFLHFENDSSNFNTSNHPNPKLRKIYDLHDKIVHRFKPVYIPEQNISIGESLIAFKGRLAWKQYIPSKRARFGIKLYQLCESQSFYIWNSVIYTGKGTAFNSEFHDFGLSIKSVLSLLSDLTGKGYCLTTDNFYLSPELAEILIQEKTDICGPMKSNRKGLPPLLKTTELKKGEITAFQKGKICVMKWKDKKPIIMLSTLHNSEMVQVQPKHTKSTAIFKPKAVVSYNNTMGGVDRSDQCISYYPVVRNRQPLW